ncbi:hypothetical protein Tco_0777758 [Tanacetum coccineum]
MYTDGYGVVREVVWGSMGIHINGVWCDSPDQIKLAALNHFSFRFKEDKASRPRFFNPLFWKLLNSDALFLESSISLNEVKEAVWSCASSKALGPEGLNFHFIKSYWDILKVDRVDSFWSFVSLDSILINRSPTKEFSMERGLRQGDPLSHLLFLLVAESLQDSQRGISWVKWKSMLFDPDKGGLGIGSIHATNLGLLGKWKWRFLRGHDALWRLVIREFYGEDGGFCATSNSSIFGGVWGDIIKASASIESIVAA